MGSLHDLLDFPELRAHDVPDFPFGQPVTSLTYPSAPDWRTIDETCWNTIHARFNQHRYGALTTDMIEELFARQIAVLKEENKDNPEQERDKARPVPIKLANLHNAQCESGDYRSLPPDHWHMLHCQFPSGDTHNSGSRLHRTQVIERALHALHRDDDTYPDNTTVYVWEYRGPWRIGTVLRRGYDRYSHQYRILYTAPAAITADFRRYNGTWVDCWRCVSKEDWLSSFSSELNKQLARSHPTDTECSLS